MDGKKIDNEIKTQKQRINELDNKLSIEKAKLQKLDDMQESLYELNKNMSKCIELLAKSIIGPTTNRFFNEMENNNRMYYKRGSMILEEESASTMRNINKIYKDKIAEIEKGRKQKEE